MSKKETKTPIEQMIGRGKKLTTIEAFEHLINENWEGQTAVFKSLYKSYRSKYGSGTGGGIGHGKILQMLIDAGYKEGWQVPDMISENPGGKMAVTGKKSTLNGRPLKINIK